LIARAVERCEARKCNYLIYGKYNYGTTKSSLAEFKRRNGFEHILVPKYYIPLTVKGRVSLKLGLHRGARALVPSPLLVLFRRLRSHFYQRKRLMGATTGKDEILGKEEQAT
jgi:hypothetical protein